MPEPRALIFDVDGTLAETEELHRLAFNRAFATAGLDIAWDRPRYRQLLAVTGGKRRILRHFADAGLPPDEALAGALHQSKNRFYADAMAEGIALRPGVAGLMNAAREAGLKLAIATTTGRSNLGALLAAVDLPPFDAIVTGEDVAALKPDPEAYVLALRRLDLDAGVALAFEDSVNGLKAATGAGLRTVVTPGLYTAGEDFSSAAIVVADLVGFDWRA
ncbi:MAG: HAD-IA family hydrolase [Devosia nanyangense]|uniref:HAD-IA family hydrolase n=1 Tax=Devosia nanyangense TaxID=1228055 RepID=A0A933L5N4_9HYPH|nr:HAD-IA family hydrolase [Devosia nanyangense]